MCYSARAEQLCGEAHALGAAAAAVAAVGFVLGKPFWDIPKVGAVSCSGANAVHVCANSNISTCCKQYLTQTHE